MTRLRPALLLAVLAAALLPASALAKPKSWEYFKTPSGHIRCVSYKSSTDKRERGIRCDLDDATNKQPPKPKSCEFDWGASFGLRAQGRGHRNCVSDAIQPTRHVLRYGQTWKRVGITCRSRSTGLTCKNAKGHGFFVSRDRQRTF
jgi:hypothetical protein